MLRTIEAIIDTEGRIRLLEEVSLETPQRVLVTLLEDEENDINFCTNISESALARDWDRPEEDEAWSQLSL